MEKKELLKVRNKLSFPNKVKSLMISSSRGKIIIARQFVSMSKREMFELHSEFLRIHSKEKTTCEKGDNRFMYKILKEADEKEGDIYIVLVLHVDFNLIQATEMMQRVYRLIRDFLSKGNIVGEIKAKAYDICLTLDDLVNSVHGMEPVSPSEVLSNLRMESHDEKFYLEEKHNKEIKARDNMIKAMEEIERLKRENKYIDNSVSNVTLEEKEERENIERNIQTEMQRMITGMNLKRRIIQHLIHESQNEMRLNTFMFACQNMMTNVMLRELHKDLNEEEEDEYEPARGQIIIARIESLYDSDEEV